MIMSIRSPSHNAVIFVLAARMNTRQLAQILCSSQQITARSSLFWPRRRSARARQHASPCAITPPLAAHCAARGMLTAQIPIAEPAARPTERTSRDFVPWRFSDAGLRSAWIARRCRRPKTCT